MEEVCVLVSNENPELHCDCCHKGFKDPVATPWGHTYEKACILIRFETQRRNREPTTDPITGKSFDETMFVPNEIVKQHVPVWYVR